MNNAVFGKIMENVVKHGDIELEITNKIRNYLVSEPNYHTTKLFSKNLLVKLNMPVPVYLGLSILQISKKLMFEFGMIMLNQSINTTQNYATWIRIVLSFILKLKMFVKTLLMILKNDSIYQIMMSIDHFLLENKLLSLYGLLAKQ